MMSRKEIMDKIQDIFRNNFDDDTLIITESTSAQDIEDWDSFEQMRLIVAMEHEFKIKLDIRAVAALKDVGDMSRLLEKKLSTAQ